MQRVQVELFGKMITPKPLSDYEKEVLADLKVELSLFSQKPKKQERDCD